MIKKITYWQDGEFWLGYLNDYPDFVTQGESFEDLIEHLKDIYQDIESEIIPGKRKEIEVEFN
jgi:predicted RNase H-like HicB family nuclease